MFRLLSGQPREIDAPAQHLQENLSKARYMKKSTTKQVDHNSLFAVKAMWLDFSNASTVPSSVPAGIKPLIQK